MKQFNSEFRSAREKAGLQCKFYRILERHGFGKAHQVREQIRQCRGNEALRRQRYGFIARNPERYSWMEVEDQRMRNSEHL